MGGREVPHDVKTPMRLVVVSLLLSRVYRDPHVFILSGHLHTKKVRTYIYMYELRSFLTIFVWRFRPHTIQYSIHNVWCIYIVHHGIFQFFFTTVSIEAIPYIALSLLFFSIYIGCIFRRVVFLPREGVCVAYCLSHLLKNNCVFLSVLGCFSFYPILHHCELDARRTIHAS